MNISGLTGKVLRRGVKVLISMLALGTCQGMATAGSFTICVKGADQCYQADDFGWKNKVIKRDYEQRKSYKVDYDGIILAGNAHADKKSMALYLKGYQGPGDYSLEGTESMKVGSVRNAVYSNYTVGWAYWVAPKQPEGSHVKVTKDQDGKISGEYSLTVYYAGKVDKYPVRIHGEFKDISYRP